MKTLYLHIGHGKTGSSFLQAILSNNRAWLREEQSIHYPVDSDSAAERGMISSGNGNLLMRSVRDGAWRADVVPDEGCDVLLSSELLFHSFFDWIDSNLLQMNNPFEKVKVLLFIRDPLELIGSSYQQVVKRHGYADDIDSYTEGFRFYRNLRDSIHALLEVKHLELTIVNYSVVKDDIQVVLENFLGISSFPDVPFPMVNRSMTYAELILQRKINREIGARGRAMADALCNNHPNIRSDVIIPTSDAWGRFMLREQKFIEAVNKAAPPAARLGMEYVPVDETKWARTLGLGQIGTIGSVLGHLIREGA